MAMKPSQHLTLANSQRLAVMGRMRMADWIEMPEREFAREIKFRLLPDLAMAVREWVGPRLQADPNASSPGGSGYDITSLYCDTPEFDVFQRRGSYGRSKYRIRRYGRSDVVFLERKMRTQGKLTKRRSIIPMRRIAW